MKKFLSLLTIIVLVVFSISSCRSTIPPGNIGKLMGTNGFEPGIYQPSKIWVGFTEKLYLVETTTKKYNETISVLLKDKLTLRVNVVFRGRIDGAEQVINTIFNDMFMNDEKVTTDEVYEVYAKMILLNTAREIISQYNVDEVNINYARITTEIYNAVSPKLAKLPITISDVTIGNIEYPTIVTKAIETAKETRMLIEKEKALVQSRLVKVQGEEQIAKAHYKIKMLQAKQIRDFNKMINSGITKELLQLKRLEVDMEIAQNLKDNNNVIYMPMPMMNNIAHIRAVK